MHNIILSGGIGSRLWPLSRKSKPKQYLALFEGESLFEMTLKRNQRVSDKVTVIGNADNHNHSTTIGNRHAENPIQYIVEATPRNTAPAIAFAAFQANADDILLITPSDHIIMDHIAYEGAIAEAKKLAEGDYIVTFGVEPTHPETGYGYIEYDQNNVRSFREKPDLETAKKFLDQGGFLWNSGMFCFKAKVYLSELEKYSPEVYSKSLLAWEKAQNGVMDKESSLAIPSISIDYAVMEKSDRVKVVPATFKWSDMGSFEAIYDYLKQVGHPIDESGNMVIGTTDKHVSFVGLKNTILVYSDDALLVLDRSSSQDVKKVYDQLAKMNSSLLE